MVNLFKENQKSVVRIVTFMYIDKTKRLFVRLQKYNKRIRYAVFEKNYDHIPFLNFSIIS